MRGSDIFKMLDSSKASHRVQAAIARKWHRARRKVEREPHYANYDTYLRHSLGYRTTNCLTPTPKFEDEQTRLAAAMDARVKRMRELISIMNDLSGEARELMAEQFRSSLAMCDLTGSGVRPALTVMLTQNVVNDIYARLHSLDFVFKNLELGNTPEFIVSSILSLNQLSSDMMDIKIMKIGKDA